MASKNVEKIIDSPPAVSILMPVYNGEPWLSQSLGSLLGQTMKNIEIICIDDKSSDSSLKILQEYKNKDSRIRVIVKEKNEGYTASHNVGLAMATGEYIGFVDQDDFVDLDFFEKLYNQATATNADIAKGKVRVVAYNGKETNFGPSFADIKNNKAVFFTAFWSAIYRRDFIEKNKINFPADLTITGDDVFLVKAVTLANKVELVEDTYYHYIRRKNSLFSEFLCVEKLESCVKAINRIVDFINNKVIDNREAYNFIFGTWIEDLLYFKCTKSNTLEGYFVAIRGAIELFEKCKYKDDLKNKIGENYVNFLSKKDEVALLADLLGRVNKVVCFELFGFIPVLKIIYKCDAIEVILFRCCPLLKISRKYDSDYYYLFYYIPFMKKKTAK